MARFTVLGVAVLTSALTVALTACGTGQVGQSSSGTTAGGAPNKNLVLAPGVQNEPFYISMQCSAAAGAKAAGYALNTQARQKVEATLQTPIGTELGAT